MLNENIKAIRKSKGLSQEELAVKLNVVRQTISKWEQGLPVNTQNSTDNQIVTISDPVTKTELIRALQKVGVTKNQLIEVHSSLSAFSYVIGGARTVVDALMEAVGEE